MMMGFVTSWPVNRWLLQHGIKERRAGARQSSLPAGQKIQ
jgi:hypothetical protein